MSCDHPSNQYNQDTEDDLQKVNGDERHGPQTSGWYWNRRSQVSDAQLHWSAQIQLGDVRRKRIFWEINVSDGLVGQCLVTLR
jgi:hypothetical protein